MTWSIGLHLGDTVLEMVAQPVDAQDLPVKRLRAFVSPGNIESTIQNFLTQNDIQEVSRLRFVSMLPIKIMDSAHGSPPAVLMTSGFENWLELNLPVQQQFFTLNPERSSLLVERDFVFGINERTSFSGVIEKKVDLEELEFLVAKLELHQIKTISVGFLHSQTNPENERTAAEFLRSKGFEVFLSSDYNSKDSELARFWAAILNAYVKPYYLEKLNLAHKAFEGVLTDSADCKVGAHEMSSVLSGRLDPLKTAFTLSDHIAERFARTTPMLYCGLEEFLFFPSGLEKQNFWRTDVGMISAPHLAFKRLRYFTLSKLGKGFFSEITFSSERSTFDPGPMIMGRGLTPTLIDLFHIVEPRNEILGLTEKVSDRGLMRLNENLFAFSRNLTESTTPDGNALAEKLLQLAAESWRAEIGAVGKTGFSLCGPMAKHVQKRIGGSLVGADFFVVDSLLMNNHG